MMVIGSPRVTPGQPDIALVVLVPTRTGYLGIDVTKVNRQSHFLFTWSYRRKYPGINHFQSVSWIEKNLFIFKHIFNFKD